MKSFIEYTCIAIAGLMLYVGVCFVWSMVDDVNDAYRLEQISRFEVK